MLQLTLSAHPRSAAEARRFAADVLREWHEDPLSDGVVLLVSELVTNAVLHAGSPVRVALWRSAGRVRVDVADQSPLMPGVRDYDDEATTGRGMDLVGMIAADWGVEARHPHGKSVWFELPSTHPDAVVADAAPPTLEIVPPAVENGDTTTIHLLGAPVRLFPAMQQHTDALLREYALIGLESEDGPPRLGLDLNPIRDQVAAAVTAGNSTTELIFDAPRGARPSVEDVREALEHADAMAASGMLLQNPPLPEVRGCRDWFFDQVLTQIDGDPPDPWVVTMGSEVRAGADIDFALVLDQLDDAVVVADDENHVAYANAAVEAILGWPPHELAGRRLTTIIPERLHEAHVAGYTRYLVTREPRLIGQPVRVPARRRDGSEVDVELTLHAFRPPGARQMFMGVLHRPEPAPAGVQVDLAPALQLLEAVTARVAAGGVTVPGLLELLGSRLERRFAAWWTVDGGQLCCLGTWESTPGAYASFLEVTRHRRFDPGEGLPGRVWESGTAQWVPDVVADANFPRVAVAVQHRLRAAYALPVISGDRITGVVELFGESVEPPDEPLLQALGTVGRLLGLVSGD